VTGGPFGHWGFAAARGDLSDRAWLCRSRQRGNACSFASKPTPEGISRDLQGSAVGTKPRHQFSAWKLCASGRLIPALCSGVNGRLISGTPSAWPGHWRYRPACSSHSPLPRPWRRAASPARGSLDAGSRALRAQRHERRVDDARAARGGPADESSLDRGDRTALGKPLRAEELRGRQ
jgi:hypothetical protein